MIRALFDWVGHRTSLKKVADLMLLEHIPGGAKWRYIWGSCLSFVFLLQLLTGVLLMTAYSPGNTTAWGSVYWIQYEMDFGWLIRGLHHFGSQAMVVLLFIHMLQVVIAGAHLAPREFNWWIGLLLMGVVLGLSLTGYLLPWDQKGYWATQVATKIMSGMPLIGGWLQQIVVGGPEYGTATLTRFFALHVAILPGLMIVLLIAHLALFRRHGVTYTGYPEKPEKSAWFWPEQVFRDMVAILVIFGILLFLVFNGHGHPIHPHDGHAAAMENNDQDFYTYWAKAGQRGLGANLDAPADPDTRYDPRPEWYYLFLFQLLKYFEGDQALIGSLVIPGAVSLVLFLLPLLGIGRMRPYGHAFSVVFVVALIAAISSLTCLALAQDTPEEIPHVLLNRLALNVIPLIAGIYLFYLAISAVFEPGVVRWLLIPAGQTVLALLMFGTFALVLAAVNNQVPDEVAELVREKIAEQERANTVSARALEKKLAEAKHFQEAVADASKKAERAIELAVPGIPVEGGAFLLRRDPLTQFKPLFLQNCASCHSYADEEVVKFDKKATYHPGFYIRNEKGFEQAKFTAADLAGFGTKEWIHNFLWDPQDDRFFGRIKNEKDIPIFYTMSDWVEEQKEAATEAGKLDKLKADFGLIAEMLASNARGEKMAEKEFDTAYRLFTEEYNCTRCHSYEGPQESFKGKKNMPTLTGYASAKWLHQMIRSPGHPEMYGTGNILKVKGKDDEEDKVKSLMPAFMPTGTVQAELQRKDYSLILNNVLKINQTDFMDLSDIDRELIVRYLTQDYRVVFGGQEITGVEKKEKK